MQVKGLFPPIFLMVEIKVSVRFIVSALIPGLCRWCNLDWSDTIEIICFSDDISGSGIAAMGTITRVVCNACG